MAHQQRHAVVLGLHAGRDRRRLVDREAEPVHAGVDVDAAAADEAAQLRVRPLDHLRCRQRPKPPQRLRQSLDAKRFAARVAPLEHPIRHDRQHVARTQLDQTGRVK